MSFLGRNIKKIRTAKNISQSAFADIFNLKRASIGAYEEGRAEAKIETVIAIADHFGLSIDQLLKKELTINDIYHIDALSKKVEFPSKPIAQHTEIPLVRISDRETFINYYNNNQYLNQLQTIKLPGLIKNSIAIEYCENSGPLAYSGLRSGDFLIGQRIIHKKIDQIIKNQLFAILTSNDIFISKIENRIGNIEIFSERNLNLMDESIRAVWTIYQVISTKIPLTDQIEIRLQNIENQISKLLSK
jgi:transcriptional regulator with XRE-family HTH domain